MEMKEKRKERLNQLFNDHENDIMLKKSPTYKGNKIKKFS